MSWMISQVLSKGTYTQNMSLRSQKSNQSNQKRKSKIPGASFFVLNNPVYFIKNYHSEGCGTNMCSQYMKPEIGES